MSALLHPRPAALLHSAERQYLSSDALGKLAARMRRSHALADMLPSLLMSGVVTAVVVAVLQLTWYGPIPGFGVQWLESTLIAWPIAFPIAYFAGPTLLKLANYISSPTEADQAQRSGLTFGDIAAASARATERHGFTVLRNLKVREDYTRA